MPFLCDLPKIDIRNEETRELLRQIDEEQESYKGPVKTTDDYQRDALVGSLRKLENPTEAEQKLLAETEEKQRAFAQVEIDHNKKLHTLYTQIFDIAKQVMMGKVFIPFFGGPRISVSDANAAYLVQGIVLGSGLNPSIMVSGYKVGDFNSLSDCSLSFRLFHFGSNYSLDTPVIRGFVIEPDEYIKFMESRKSEIVNQLDNDLAIIKQRIEDNQKTTEDLKMLHEIESVVYTEGDA